MSRKHHHLKTETEYFQAVERGKKKFEIRINDRDFKQYDIVILHETVNGSETGRALPPLEIGYVFHGGKCGLDPKSCAFCW